MNKNGKFFVGVDVGGTKMLAALVKKSGEIISRMRCSTPRTNSSKDVVKALLRLIDDLLHDSEIKRSALRAIGIGVPGIVDPDTGKVILAPNMKFRDVDLGKIVEKYFDVPVVLGNDVNLGTMGEKWLGTAHFARSAVGIFVGTGIGAGVIVDGKLFRGAREAAGEIGHIVMQIGGPQCGCGNFGCLEALASRSAIERDIRQAVAAGRKTVLTQLMDGQIKVIRSSILRHALEEGDPLTTRIVQRAAEVLGYACLTVRHLIDPEVIILGGGVIEACGDFIIPVVERIIRDDKLPGARPGGRIVRSVLGDDAVALGAAAAALEVAGFSPWQEVRNLPEYPELSVPKAGVVAAGKKTFKKNLVVLPGGKIRLRENAGVEKTCSTNREIGVEELKGICKGKRLDFFAIGTGFKGEASLTQKAERYLRQKGISFKALATPQAVEEFNHAFGRKAALLHISC